MLHERSNITAPFAEHLQFPEKRILHIQTWQKKIKKTRIRALYIFKVLYTGCSTKEAISLLKAISLYKHFGWIVGNPHLKRGNQHTIHFEITLYRVLHERCNNFTAFMDHLNFKKKWLLQKRSRWIVRN